MNQEPPYPPIGHATGYGPSSARRCLFNGDERSYELWEVKFLAYLRLRNLHDVISQVEVDPDRNAEVYSELVQVLDDRSLSLIIRDAKDNGKEAIKILRRHYQPKGKPRVITLYQELTSLSKSSHETITDYVIRAESTAAALRDADEVISDSLLVAMCIKGLPQSYKAFTTVITQREDPIKFSDFKIALRNHEDTEQIQQSSSSVMTLSNPSIKNGRGKSHSKYNSEHFKIKNETNRFTSSKRWCDVCRSPTHDTKFCRKLNQNSKRWCSVCKNNSHETAQCRKLQSKNTSNRSDSYAKMTDISSRTDDEHSFAFGCEVNPFFDVHSHHNINSLLVDSGASTHIVNDRALFINFNDSFNASKHVIELANGSRLSNIVEGSGDAIFDLVDNCGKTYKASLKNALYIPSFSQNIFSVQAAVKNGAKVTFDKNEGSVVLNKVKFPMAKTKDLYYLNTLTLKKNLSKTKTKSLSEWHRILGHCNIDDILKLENCSNGMKISEKQKFDCETCLKGKMTQTRSRIPDARATKPFEKVHLDLAGPIDPVSKNDFRFAMICADDFSGLNCVYLLKKKSDTSLAFKKYLSDVSRYGNVKSIRTDCGGEFESNEFQNICIENKISHERSSPHSPHQNGTAERQWRVLFEMARCLLLESNLPKFMWSYALMCSAHIRNRCFNERLTKTPFEAVTGMKPDISKLHKFGQICFSNIQNPKKLDARAEEAVFVGYDKYSPAYLVYFPQENTVKRVRNVKFPDNLEHKDEIIDVHDTNDYEYEKCDDNYGFEEEEFVYPKGGQTLPDQSNDLPQRDDPTDIEENDQTLNEQSKSKRQRNKPKYLNDYYLDNDDESNEEIVNSATLHYCYSNVMNVPQNYSEAISCPNHKQWLQAMNNEMQALGENDTYDVVPLPHGRGAIKGKWVYSFKHDKDNKEIFKARYVAKGFSQIEGLDYQETFSPTARMNSIRILTEIVVQNDLELHQMDVKSAYLNAPIDYEIYVEQPKGFEITSPDEKLFFRLKKSLYGLKQSGRNWNHTLHAYLAKQGYKKSINDPCMYYKPEENIFILVWVDDLLIAAKQNAMISVKKYLANNFKMKDLGKVSIFLGIEFKAENNKITMSQSKYISKILERFNMQNCKPRTTPCEMGSQTPDSEPLNEDEQKLYRQIIGALIYVMTATRPDISYAVTKLSQFMNCGTKYHMSMAKHLLRFLNGTIEKKLTFIKSDKPLTLSGMCDADWANSNDRRSITGYGFKLSENGPMISWKSKKQPTVALSSCEAEYQSLVSATQEGKYLISFLNEILHLNQTQFTILCDNQGAIALAKNPVKHQRCKHVDIKYHFIRNEIADKLLNVEYVPSEHNVADVFTKPMSKFKLEKFSPHLFGQIQIPTH